MIVLPVHRVCMLLKESLESDPRFNDLYLTGEVSNFTRSPITAESFPLS